MANEIIFTDDFSLKDGLNILLGDVLAGSNSDPTRLGEPVKATLQSVIEAITQRTKTALFKGVANPTTVPETNGYAQIYYLAATGGTYANFGNIMLQGSELAALKYNGQEWTKITIATFSGGGNGMVLVEADDTPGYLFDKVIGNNSINTSVHEEEDGSKQLVINSNAFNFVLNVRRNRHKLEDGNFDDKIEIRIDMPPDQINPFLALEPVLGMTRYRKNHGKYKYVITDGYQLGENANLQRLSRLVPHMPIKEYHINQWGRVCSLNDLASIFCYGFDYEGNIFELPEYVFLRDISKVYAAKSRGKYVDRTPVYPKPKTTENKYTRHLILGGFTVHLPLAPESGSSNQQKKWLGNHVEAEIGYVVGNKYDRNAGDLAPALIQTIFFNR